MLRSLRPREGKRLTQGHTARQWHSQHWNSGLLPYRPVCFSLVKVNQIKCFTSDDVGAVLALEKVQQVRKLKISRIY